MKKKHSNGHISSVRKTSQMIDTQLHLSSKQITLSDDTNIVSLQELATLVRKQTQIYKNVFPITTIDISFCFRKEYLLKTLKIITYNT